MDLEIVDKGNGGDFVKTTKDLSVIYGFENMPYLALFGGNVEESTPLTRNPNEQAFDWWGNDLFFPNDSSVQMNSETERMLRNVSLTSSGRLQIQRAVVKDLEFMKPFANVSVTVDILNINAILIGIRIVKPDNLQQKDFIYIWDATNRELLEREVRSSGAGGSVVINTKIFDYTFDDSFE